MVSDERTARADPDIDLSTPTPARVYDHQLGGAHSFSVDRDASRRLEEIIPGAARTAWCDRAFPRRAVNLEDGLSPKESFGYAAVARRDRAR